MLKSSFLPDIVDEIRHDCKHLQRSVISNRFLGWDAIKSGLSVWIVDLEIWVGQDLLLQTLGQGSCYW